MTNDEMRMTNNVQWPVASGRWPVRVFWSYRSRGMGTRCDGLTLTELLITTTIIGIIMLGVVAADHALLRGEQGSSRSAAVTMRVNAMMSHMSKNAALAIGTDSQRGICISSDSIADAQYHASCGALTSDVTADNNNYICFHQDFDFNLGGLTDPLDPTLYNGTPDNFSDDRWVCYTRRVVGTISYLHSCIQAYGNGPADAQNPTALAPCLEAENATNVRLGIVTVDTFTDNTDPARDTSPKFIINETPPTLAFEVTLRSRYDPSAAEDRMNNPQIEFSSRVAPDGHAF